MAKFVLSNNRYINNHYIFADVESPQTTELPDDTREDRFLKKLKPGEAAQPGKLTRHYAERSKADNLSTRAVDPDRDRKDVTVEDKRRDRQV